MNILLLEDDDLHRPDLAKFLEAKFSPNANVWPVESAAEARTLLKENPEHFHMLIADVRQDGKPLGLELVLEVAYRLPSIVYSAHPETSFAEFNNPGPIVFIHRTDKFDEHIVSKVSETWAKIQFVSKNREQEKHLRNHSLSHSRGAVLAIRVHLSVANKDKVPTDLMLDWDYMYISFIARTLQASAASHGGQVYAIADQSIMVFFPHNDEGGNVMQRAFDTFRDVKIGVGDMDTQVLKQFPFSGGVVEGRVAAGMFGSQVAGIATIVGRVGDTASQIADLCKAGELGYVEALISNGAKTAIGRVQGQRRPIITELTGFLGEIDITAIDLR